MDSERAARGVNAKHARGNSPTDLLILSRSVAALNAANSSLFLAKAAGAPTHEEGFFQRRRAELLAKNAKRLGIGGFVDVGGFPLNRTRDGGLIALFPLDELALTERNARTFQAISKAAQSAGPATIAITARFTPMAEQEIAALGWTIAKAQ